MGRVPTAIDLFSGCGGMTEGLKQAGFRVIAAVEIDDLAAETYLENHPEVRLWSVDIRDLNPVDVMRELGLSPGKLDLLAGCPPCQGFSTMRTRNGHHRVVDARNDLVLVFGEWIRAFRPKSVMLENVPGLLRDDRLKKLQDVLRELGYSFDAKIQDAADYGVPQRRLRMILMARANGKLVFPERIGERVTVRDVIGKLKRPEETHDDPLHVPTNRRSELVLRRIRSIPKDGGSRSALPEELQLRCHRETNGFKDVYGRMKWDDVAPTLTAGCINPSKGRFLHPEQDREITLREAALLQGFPPHYKFSLRRGRYPVAALIGNALPPELVRHHAKCLMDDSE